MAADNNNAFVDAQTISTSLTLGETVGADDDKVDYYRFVAPTNGTLVVTPTGLEIGTQVFVFDANQNLLVQRQIRNDFSSQQFDFNVGAGREYFIRIDSADSNGESQYTIGTSLETFAVAEFAFNNTVETAESFLSPTSIQSITNNTELSGYGLGNRTIGPGDSVDYYQFTAVHSRLASVELGTMGQDLTLRIIDSNNQLVGESTNEGVQNESVQFQMTAGETYYFQVSGGTDAATRYDIWLYFSDTNDSFEQAEVLEQNVNYRDVIAFYDPDDYYRIDAIENGSLRLNYYGSLNDFQVEVYNSDFELINVGSHDRKEFSSLSTPVLAGETYFVRVNGEAMLDNRLDVGYTPTLSATLVPEIPDDNETIATASLRSDSFMESNFVGSFDPEDFYSFTVSSSGIVTVSLTGMTSDLDIRIYSADGRLIDASESRAEGGRSSSFYASEGSEYFVRVTPAEGAFSDYTVSVSIEDFTLVGDGGIQGNTDSDARLALGAEVESDIETAGEKDWFQIEVSEGEEILISAVGLGEDAVATLDIVLRDEDGDFVAQALDQDGNGARVLLSTAGSYWVEVRSFAGDTGDYSIRATLPGAEVVSGESLDIAGGLDSASVLSINADVIGQVDNGTDSDWYQLDVAENDSITVSVLGSETADGTLSDPILILRDEEGVLVSEVTASAGQNVELTVETAGTYWIDVRSGAGVSGTYTLRTVSNNSEGELDVPGSVTTSRTLSDGDVFSASLESSTDKDWFRLDVEADQVLNITVAGAESGAGTLEDPDIVLRTATGAFFDQAIGEAGEDVSLIVTQPGTLYLDVRSFAGETGSYTVSVTDTSVSPAAIGSRGEMA